MEITKQILNPQLEKLVKGFEELDRQIVDENHDRALSLGAFLQRRIKKVRSLQSSVAGSDVEVQTQNINKDFKKLKLDLRFAQRRWARHVTTVNRLIKVREKDQYVATFAA